MGVLIMEKSYLLIITTILVFQSCDFNDNVLKYDQKLVVFATISAGLPVLDTVSVSRSAFIDEDVTIDELWVNDATVSLVNDSTNQILTFKNVGEGKYFPLSENPTPEELGSYMNFIIQSGFTYHLIVEQEQDSVFATTTVPDRLDLTSSELPDYTCPDGEVIPPKMINVNNLDGTSIEQFSQLLMDPREFILDNNIDVDSIVYRFGDCFTKSFASYPFFGVDFDANNFQTINILNYALESNVKGLEPLDSLSTIFDSDSGGFFDYNYNGIRDSIFTNLIYDTTLNFQIWKGPYFRDENNTPYRINPWQWNVEESPTPVMWLYFDYYGYQLLTFQATSESYFNYFSGDPSGQNMYLLPDSNFEGGLGVFYSNYSSSFIVYVQRD